VVPHQLDRVRFRDLQRAARGAAAAASGAGPTGRTGARPVWQGLVARPWDAGWGTHERLKGCVRACVPPVPQIWDFALSTVKPVMHQKTGAKLSTLLFAPKHPVVVCGGEDGSVKAYR
jgi:hypothetical protein